MSAEEDLERIQDPAIERVLRGILETQRDILARLQASEDAFVAHLKDAFPASDPEGHRRYHELMIAELDERRKLRRAIQEKTISGLVWAVMVGIGIAAWKYLKSALGSS